MSGRRWGSRAGCPALGYAGEQTLGQGERWDLAAACVQPGVLEDAGQSRTSLLGLSATLWKRASARTLPCFAGPKAVASAEKGHCSPCPGSSANRDGPVLVSEVKAG